MRRSMAVSSVALLVWLSGCAVSGEGAASADGPTGTVAQALLPAPARIHGTLLTYESPALPGDAIGETADAAERVTNRTVEVGWRCKRNDGGELSGTSGTATTNSNGEFAITVQFPEVGAGTNKCTHAYRVILSTAGNEWKVYADTSKNNGVSLPNNPSMSMTPTYWSASPNYRTESSGSVTQSFLGIVTKSEIKKAKAEVSVPL